MKPTSWQNFIAVAENKGVRRAFADELQILAHKVITKNLT